MKILEIYKANNYTLTVNNNQEAYQYLPIVLNSQTFLDKVSSDAMERAGITDQDDAFDERGNYLLADTEDDVIREVKGDGDEMSQLTHLIDYIQGDYSYKWVEEE